MKRLLICIYVCAVSLCVCASPYNPAQERFISDVYNYLSSNGYSVSYNSETGEIKVAINQVTYNISVDETENSPFHVLINTAFDMKSLPTSEYTRLFAIINLTNTKTEYAKVSLVVMDDDRLLDFIVEGLYLDSNNFKMAVPKYLDSIRNCVSAFFNVFNDKSVL